MPSLHTVVATTTNECDDRVAFDIKVEMGLAKMILHNSTARNGNGTQTPMATVAKDLNKKTVIVTAMLRFAHLWAAC